MGSAVSQESVGSAKGKLYGYVPAQAKRNGGSVLVLPGGGYQRCCLKKEGVDVCKFLFSLGYAAYALDYTLDPSGWHGRAAAVEPAVEDGVTALMAIRREAEENGMDPTKVAVIGFSAGGHLATCIARALAEGADGAEMKPRTIVQAYSDAYSDICPYCRGPEIKATLLLRRIGCKPAPEGAYTRPGDQHRWCDMVAAAKAMPPTFIVASTRDECCPPEKHADVMNAALESEGVPVRYIKKDFGPHGWGLKGWQADLQTWLNEQLSTSNLRSAHGAGGGAGGDISGAWMVTVDGQGRSEYVLDCRPSGEVTGKGRPAQGSAWISDLKGFHAHGGKFTWTSYVNNREAGRFEANVVEDLRGFSGTGTLITGRRLKFTGTRTTPLPAAAGAAAAGQDARPQSLVREAAIDRGQAALLERDGLSQAGISMAEVRADQDQVALIRDQAKELEAQLARESAGTVQLRHQVDVCSRKVQNVEGQRARYGENPKNTAELEKAQADLEEAQGPLDAQQAKVSSLRAELEEQQGLLAAVQAALA